MDKLIELMDQYSSKKLSKKIYYYPFVDTSDINLIFAEACYMDHLDIVEHIVMNFVFDPHSYNDLALACAHEAGHRDIINFLVSCESFLGKFNIHKNRSRIFRYTNELNK